MKSIIALLLAATLTFANAGWTQTVQTPYAKLAVTKPEETSNKPQEFGTVLKLQQQKLDFFDKRLDYQDKRIGDLTAILSLTLAFFGALMTVIVIFFSLRSKREAVLEAKDEARTEIQQQAPKVIEGWLDDKGKDLLAGKIDGLLKVETDKAIANFEARATQSLDKLDREQEAAHRQNEEQNHLIKRLSDQLLAKGTPTPEEKREAGDSTRNLESKPPKDYRSNDWMLLALKAYWDEKPALAVEYFSNAADLSSQPQERARALFYKGVTLGQMGRNEEEFACYDEVLKRYSDAPEAELREQVAKALVNKGVSLGRMGRNEEEIACYDEVLKRYGDAPEADLREQVANALNGRGFMLLCEAKKVWCGGKREAARSLLERSLQDILTALERDPDNPICLGNHGYVLFLLDRGEEAQIALAKAIELGGEKLRQGELDDAEIYPLPQDEKFKSLIRSL